MERYDPVADAPGGLDRLTKGLHEFHCPPGQRGTKLPDDLIMDYLDAFIEEAYEHEYKEERHRAPSLEGGDPYMKLARAVYNELLVFAVHNPNLRRAIQKFKIRNPLYVLKRMVAQGLCRVNTENYEANRQAQVGGYWPEKVEPLSMESPTQVQYGYHKSDSMGEAFAATERAMTEHNIKGGHRRAEGPEMVQLQDDDIDPFAALKKSIDAKPDALGRHFVMDQGKVVAQSNHNCPIHGLADLTKSQNLTNIYVQCTCPSAE